MADNDLPAGFSATPPAPVDTPKPKGLDAIHSYFKDKGNFLNPHAADALAATSFSETGGDPYAINKSSKAAGAFQWLGPRKAAFMAQGDTRPEGMAAFAMSELPKYPRAWKALNDPSVSREDLQKILIDDFEAPGGSAEKGYGEAQGDFSRAQKYKPPQAGDVQKSDLPPAQSANGLKFVSGKTDADGHPYNRNDPYYQTDAGKAYLSGGKPAAKDNGLPPGFSDKPQALDRGKGLPAGFSSQAPGAQDPSIAARKRLQDEIPPKTWAEMAKDPANPMWKRVGSAIVEEGKRIGENAWGGFTVFGDVASGKAKVEDPETQKRIMDAAGWFGNKGAPGEAEGLGAAGKATPKEQPTVTIPEAGEGKMVVNGQEVRYKDGDVVGGANWKPPAAEVKPAANVNQDLIGDAVRMQRVWNGKGSQADLQEHVRGLHDEIDHVQGEGPHAVDSPAYGHLKQLKEELAETQAKLNPESVTSAGAPPNEASINARKSPPVELAPDDIKVSHNAPKAAGAAGTPLHEINQQNIRDFEALNKEPTYRQKVTDAASYAKGYFGKADEAKAIIQRNQGNMNRMGAQAKEAMIPFQKFTKSLDQSEQMDMMQWLETPGMKMRQGVVLSPEAQGFADTFKSWMQSYARKIASLPGKERQKFREDFVTHLYREPKDAKAAIIKYGAKQGSGYFTKGRVFDTYEDAVLSGKPMLTTDPMALFSYYIENASKKIASWESIEDAKASNNLVYRKRENAPEGWEELKGVQDGMGHSAYAPPGFAQVFNNYASTAKALNIPGTKVDVLSAAQRAANTTTAFKLSLSGFHAALESMESVFSGLANGITKVKNGRPIAGLAEMAKAPTKPFTSFQAGRRAQKAYLDGEFGSPEMQKVVQALTDANYDFLREGGLADEYRVSKLPGFIKGWQKGIPANSGGPLKMGIRAFETTMEPVFQYYVPYLKNQAAMDMMKTYLDAHPNLTKEEFATYGRKVGSIIDSRFGEMNSSNIFWPATAKKMAQTAAISWSFTLGQAKQALGAAYDAARLPDRAYRAVKGTKPELEEIWTDRLSYAVAIGLGTSMVNSVYQYLKTGELPQGKQDLVNPRTGGQDPSTQQPERATLPNFANSYRNMWEGGVGQEAYNKLAPLWQTLIQAGENKDWKSQPIYDPNDTTTKQLEQLGSFVGSNTLTPITVGTVGDAKAGSHISSLERMFGIRAAGMRDTAPEQLKEIMSYKNAEAWYQKRKSDINAKRAQNGLGPLRVSHRQQQQLIQSYMKNPDADPLQSYGGTQ